MESLDFDLEIPTDLLQNHELIPNTGNGQVQVLTFVALTGLFGVPFLEFCVYVSGTPPPYFPIVIETITSIAEALFIRVMIGPVVVGLVQIR